MGLPKRWTQPSQARIVKERLQSSSSSDLLSFPQKQMWMVCPPLPTSESPSLAQGLSTHMQPSEGPHCDFLWYAYSSQLFNILSLFCSLHSTIRSPQRVLGHIPFMSSSLWSEPLPKEASDRQETSPCHNEAPPDTMLQSQSYGTGQKQTRLSHSQSHLHRDRGNSPGNIGAVFPVSFNNVNQPQFCLFDIILHDQRHAEG